MKTLLLLIQAFGIVSIVVCLYVFLALRQSEVFRVTDMDGDKYWSIETDNNVLVSLIK